MNDTIIFLVLAGLALVLRWLTGLGSKKEDEPDPPPPDESAPRRPPAQSEEERIRRFLEALGAPAGSAPPPPVRPRRVVTPAPRAEQKRKVKRSWAQPLPPLVTTPPVIAPPPLTNVTPATVPEEIAPPEIVVPSLLPATPASKAPSPRTAPTQSLGAMLRSRPSIRSAIILREVLGPPRGLEPIHDFANP